MSGSPHIGGLCVVGRHLLFCHPGCRPCPGSRPADPADPCFELQLRNGTSDGLHTQTAMRHLALQALGARGLSEQGFLTGCETLSSADGTKLRSGVPIHAPKHTQYSDGYASTWFWRGLLYWAIMSFLYFTLAASDQFLVQFRFSPQPDLDHFSCMAASQEEAMVA